ncbi:MAG: ATP-binding cassette domain-containing protein [Ktedonobacteraceae bacterium]
MIHLGINGVSKQYESKRFALQDISLSLQPGIIGLVGPNGAGKTTMLTMLATLNKPTRGTVTWNSIDIYKQPKVLREVLGFVPQGVGYYPQLSAVEFLCYFGELKGVRGKLLKERVEYALEMVHLTSDANRRLKSFSGGMIQRVGIAQALLNDPQLLILDEPTVGLDPAERIHFRQVIASLSGERLVLLSTHIITDVEAMASDLILLQGGKVCWQGSVQALLDATAGTAWELQLPPEEFERFRLEHQVSSAIRHGNAMAVRLVAQEQPHVLAQVMTSSLEEAYLAMTTLQKVEVKAI